MATDLAYESGGTTLEPGALDVYAPAGANDLPVVVLLHGSPSAVSKSSLSGLAQKIAAGGFVVFVPSWGHARRTAWTYPTLAEARASNAEVSCALAFAAARAGEYGGDADRLVLFGHSGGAMSGAVFAFAPAPLRDSCLAEGRVPDIAGLLTWDGDFLVADPEADGLLRKAPELMSELVPWEAIAGHPDRRVEMVVSEDPGAQFQRPFASDTEVRAFLKLRDPHGAVARLLSNPYVNLSTVLRDRVLSLADEQTLMDVALRHNGNPGRLAVLPATTHTSMAPAALPLVLLTLRSIANDRPL